MAKIKELLGEIIVDIQIGKHDYYEIIFTLDTSERYALHGDLGTDLTKIRGSILGIMDCPITRVKRSIQGPESNTVTITLETYEGSLEIVWEGYRGMKTHFKAIGKGEYRGLYQ